jgi:hypothetical protein
MKTARSASLPTGETSTQRKPASPKKSAGRMGGNPHDPLTTTNFLRS